jgi:hypothetical protein
MERSRRKVAMRGGLWFGLLGGAMAWLLHLISASVVAEFGCVSGLGERVYQGLTLVAWLQLSLTAGTTLAASAATAVAARRYRRLGRADAAADAANTVQRHTARTGMLTSGLFTVVIVFESIPILYYLQGC